MAIAALSAYPTEAVLSEMMVDSRLARRLPELEEAMATEHGFLSGISSLVWAAISEVCDMSARQLCNEVLSAAHTASGVLRTRCFNQAGDLPWKLGVGDIGQNLAYGRRNFCVFAVYASGYFERIHQINVDRIGVAVFSHCILR